MAGYPYLMPMASSEAMHIMNTMVVKNKRFIRLFEFVVNILVKITICFYLTLQIYRFCLNLPISFHVFFGGLQEKCYFCTSI
jgi:hypothetical protein